MRTIMIGRTLIAAVGVVAVALGAIIWSQIRQADAATQNDGPRSLFVQSAAHGSFDGETLTLANPSGLTLWFSDRPEHRAGYVKDADFAAGWAADGDSFASDPPNAVLYFSDGGGQAVLELLALNQSGDTLAYKTRTVAGTIPAAFAGSALFIDDGRISDYNGMGSSTDQMINSLNH